MRVIKLLGMSVLILILVACRHTDVASFTVVNGAACESTGSCEFFMKLQVGGEPFSLEDDYPEPSSQESIEINWGDGARYEGTIPECIELGVCEFAGDGLLVRHEFSELGGFRVSVELDGGIFDDVAAFVLVRRRGARSSTIFSTYNTGLARGHVDYAAVRQPHVLEAVNAIDSDVVCLQELWGEDDTLEFVEALSGAYPHAYYELTDGQYTMFNSGRNGLVILSRYPLANVSSLQLESYFINRLALYATVDTANHGAVDVLCTHLSTSVNIPPYWGDFESWEDEQNYQTGQILEYRDVDVMLGDFNSSPETQNINAYTPEPYNMIVEAGYFSPYAEQEPECTWCVGNPIASNEDGDLVLDHVFFNENYRDAVIDSWRILDHSITVKDTWGNEQETWLSDHAGVSAELN